MFLSVFRPLLGKSFKGRKGQSGGRRRPRVDRLESRCLPAMLVYVNDDFLGTDPDEDPDGEGPATAFGVDAFADIQTAVDAVEEGGTVLVMEGDYAGGVEITQSLTLQALDTPEEGEAVVGTGVFEGLNNLNGTGAIAIEADNVTVAGLTLEGTGDADANYGIFIAGDSSGAQILDNTISGFARNGITTEFNPDGSGSSNNLIAGNTISDIGSVGIYLQTGADNTVLGNVVEGDHAALTLDSEAGAVVRGNTLTGGDVGVEVFETLGPGTLTDLTLTLNNITGGDFALDNNTSTTIDAELNYWGTSSPTDDLFDGPVDYLPALTAPATDTTVAISEGDVTLIVDTATGDFTLTYPDGDTTTTLSGSGARFEDGKLKIHEHVDGVKLDVVTTGNGEIKVMVKPKGPARKLSFSLDADDLVTASGDSGSDQ